MLNRFKNTLFFLLLNYCGYAQMQVEIASPYNIKTVSFVQNNQNVIPVFKLGERFDFQFDDLFGDEANYYYKIIHCDYNWQTSDLSRNQYMRGFDDLRITTYENSFNTLQMFSHFNLQIPNSNTGLLLSGNYMLQILNDNKEIVFSRKFIVYESLVSVPLQVKRARKVADLYTKHNLEFMIRPTDFYLINPLTNIKVLMFRNGEINSSLPNVKPMYTMGTDLIYKYDVETQFWAGNEFRYFDSKDIKNSSNYISYVEKQNDMYNSHLFMDEAKANKEYVYYQDDNGNFTINRIDSEYTAIEADYSWVHFTLSAPDYFGKKDVYINGLFNNYAISPEYKMEYNAKKGIYEKPIMIKQGFTNYQYVLVDKSGKIDYENAVDGNFYQTQTNYFVIVYYRETTLQYDRVIGFGNASSLNIAY